MTLLSIALEVRHLIFEHVLPREGFTYLYRSPGRINKQNVLAQTPQLLLVCHQLREEVFDYYFGISTFLIEASLHGRSVAGLSALPPNPMPESWLQRVRKLLVLTVFEVGSASIGVADLPALRAMANLREIRIVAAVRDSNQPFAPSEPSEKQISRCLAMIQAIGRTVPHTTSIVLGLDGQLESELRCTFERSMDYILNSAHEADALMAEGRNRPETLRGGYHSLSHNMQYDRSCRDSAYDSCEEYSARSTVCERGKWTLVWPWAG